MISPGQEPAVQGGGAARGQSASLLLDLFLPFGVLALHLLALSLLLAPPQFALVLALMVAYILPPAGKETVIPVGIALGIPWWLAAAAIALVDIETGLFMAYNFDLAYRFPLLGPWLQNFTASSRVFIATHRWVGRLWFAAIVLLVMVPFFGSGGIRGSVIGRLAGMDRAMVFAAIVLGAVAGCLLIAVFSETLLLSACNGGLLPAGAAAPICSGT